MHELHGPERAAALPLFRELEYDLMPASIVEGWTPGRVFADSATRPTVALAWDRYGALFVAGAPSGAALAELRDLFEGTIAPDPQRPEWLRWFRLHCTGPDWEAAASVIVGDRAVSPRLRRLYRMAPDAARPEAPDLHDGYALAPVDAAAFARADLAGRERLETQVLDCWASVEDYLARGFGFCATHDNEVVAWCLSEHPCPGRCGLGVETVESHQRLGLAAAVSSACLAVGARRGETVLWDCSDENAGSVATAERVGFGAFVRHRAYVGAFD